MRTLILLGLLLVTPALLAAGEARFYLVTYYPGSNFNMKAGYRNQPGLKTHHTYIRKLHANDQLVMAGGIADESVVAIVLLRTGTLEEAEALVAADPGVASHIMSADVRSWDVTLSSLRFVRHAVQQPVADPDAFHLQRVDSESAINTDQPDRD